MFEYFFENADINNIFIIIWSIISIIFFILFFIFYIFDNQNNINKFKFILFWWIIFIIFSVFIFIVLNLPSKEITNNINLFNWYDTNKLDKFNENLKTFFQLLTAWYLPIFLVVFIDFLNLAKSEKDTIKNNKLINFSVIVFLLILYVIPSIWIFWMYAIVSYWNLIWFIITGFLISILIRFSNR